MTIQKASINKVFGFVNDDSINTIVNNNWPISYLTVNTINTKISMLIVPEGGND